MARPKILFILKGMPHPPMAGSSQRSAILIDALAQIGDVSLFVFGPSHRKPFLESAGYHVAATAEPTAQNRNKIGWALQILFPKYSEKIWRTLAGVKADFTPDPGLSEVLDRVLARDHFDLIVGRYLIPSVKAGILELEYPPVVIDVDDVDSKAVDAKIHSPASNLLLRVILKLRLPDVQKHEEVLLSKATKLWFSNPDDLTYARGKNADVIPNIPYEMPFRNELKHSNPDSKTILWVGSFNHRVNLDGVNLFLRYAWKNIHHENPEARFRIIGSHLPDIVRRKWNVIPGVDVVGFAESLQQHYADAALSIVPLMDGAGTKIKVLESLAYLRTCVVTRHSIAGFENLLRDRDSIRAVDELNQFSSVIYELLNDPQMRHDMEERGRAVIEKHFTREAVRNSVRLSLQSLISTSSHD